MSMKLYPSSEKIGIDKRMERGKYPWRTMAIGTSFSVAMSEIEYRSLQNYASKVGKKILRRFKVVKHDESMCYEVACIGERSVKKHMTTQAAVTDKQQSNGDWSRPDEPTGAERFKNMGFK